MWNPFA
jgi:hypothetical protein